MTRERVRAGRAEAVVRALAEGDVLGLQHLVSPSVVDHSAQPGQPTGWPGVRERAMTLCAAMPGSDVRVDVLSAAGDTVLARAELTAVRLGATPGAVVTTTSLIVVLVLHFVDDLLTDMWTSSGLVLDRATGQIPGQRSSVTRMLA